MASSPDTSVYMTNLNVVGANAKRVLHDIDKADACEDERFHAFVKKNFPALFAAYEDELVQNNYAGVSELPAHKRLRLKFLLQREVDAKVREAKEQFKRRYTFESLPLPLDPKESIALLKAMRKAEVAKMQAETERLQSIGERIDNLEYMEMIMDTMLANQDIVKSRYGMESRLPAEKMYRALPGEAAASVMVVDKAAGDSSERDEQGDRGSAAKRARTSSAHDAHADADARGADAARPSD